MNYGDYNPLNGLSQQEIAYLEEVQRYQQRQLLNNIISQGVPQQPQQQQFQPLWTQPAAQQQPQQQQYQYTQPVAQQFEQYEEYPAIEPPAPEWVEPNPNVFYTSPENENFQYPEIWPPSGDPIEGTGVWTPPSLQAERQRIITNPYAQQAPNVYNPYTQQVPDNFFGSMTNFDGNVGEGMYAYDPMLPPVGDIPWQGYTTQTPNGQAYQYQPRNMPLGVPPNMLQTNEPTMVWGYAVMTFIIFTIAVAVVRNLYRAHAGKTNIKKAIKKRFKKVFGDEPGNMDNSGLMNNNDPENQYIGPHEEAKVPSSDERDPKGSVKDYFKKGVGKVMNTFGKQDGYEEMGGPQGDKDQCNGQHTRVWGANGPDSQIDSSSQNVGPSSGSGLMNTLFGGMKVNQDKPVEKTDPETVKAIVEELDDLMINTDEPTGYMKLDEDI